MRSNKRGRGNLSALLPLLISLFLIFGKIPALSIDATAAQTIRLVLPSNDLAPAAELEEVEGGIISSDELRATVRNSNFNYNQDVTCGKHYEALNEREKALYRALVKACENVYSYGDGPKSYSEAGCVRIVSGMDSALEVGVEEYSNALEAAKYDHIDLLQLTLCTGRMSTQAIPDSTGATVYDSYLFLVCTEDHNYSQETFDAKTAQLRSARTAFLSDPSITNAKGSLGKELAIHDKSLEINTYDYDCLNSKVAAHIGHTAYGALIEGASVCDGYAMAYSYLLEGVSVESMIVSGKIVSGGSGGHAWNIVKQNGEWYEVDTTWDDQENTSMSEEDRGKMCHLYYHLTTNQINNYSYNVKLSGNRTIEGSSKRIRDGFSTALPIAQCTQYNYENTLAYLENDGSGSGIPVSLIEWELSTLSLTEGDEGDFYAYVLPVDAENKSISWNSSDTSKLTVDESGHYKALASGQSTVTATSVDGGYSKSYDITIVKKQEEGTPDDPTPEQGDDGNTASASGQESGSNKTKGNEVPLNTDQPDDNKDVVTTVTENTSGVSNPASGAMTSGNNYYWIDESGTATVTKEDNKKIKHVSIGDTVDFNGKTCKIKAIVGNAYRNCKKLTTVTIGANIEKIGAGAFNGCSSLRKITIKGNNLKTIGSGSFKKIKKGAKIIIICKDKKTYDRLVKKIKKAGAKNAIFKFKRG